jgi:SET domain-containing protein
MENKTTEFSFILKSAEYGVGVFATHNIEKETYLRLFNEENVEVSILRDKRDVPDLFREYCVDRGDMILCPKDFGHMEIGWYVNHSKDPNAYHKNYNYYALRDIKAGEEITIDYNTLEEPEESKKDYYK